jgi:hypothetical protein
MRSGLPRNFGVRCEDPDGDAITPSVGLLPEHGSIARFEPRPGPSPFPPYPFERWVDTTYVPAPGSLGPDRFSLVATSPSGDRTETVVRMEPVPADENGPGGCGYFPAMTRVGTPVLVRIRCDDAEGDPLRAEVTAPPEHGTLDAPVVGPSEMGVQEVAVRYVPAPGFEGVDAVGITVGDGGEYTIKITVSDTVVPAPMPPPMAPPLGPGGGEPTPGGDSAPGQAAPLAPVEQAREALGTRAVRLVRTAGVAQIYARTRAVRRRAGHPALAVTCALACRVDVRQKGRRGGPQRIAVEPGRAGVITVPRRARGKRLAFALRIRVAGERARRADVRVRLRGT